MHLGVVVLARVLDPQALEGRSAVRGSVGGEEALLVLGGELHHHLDGRGAVGHDKVEPR